MKNTLKFWQRWLLFGVGMVIVFVSGVIISSVTEHRSSVVKEVPAKKVEITGIEARSSVFGENYPREYQTWIDTTAAGLSGNLSNGTARDILSACPERVVLWAGCAFSKDYSSPRGHLYALEDVIHSLRTGAPMHSSAGSPSASCWVCKSSDAPRMMEAIGVDSFYNSKWADLGSEMANPVGCANCHEPKNMNLQIGNPALREAFGRQGKDITQATPQEMRSLVCAQCHAEYFFKGDNGYLTFPWDKGLTVEAIEKYYDEADFTDYIHTLSRTPLLKAQHPDYEIFQMGIHAQRGVSCADCHMPYNDEGGVKYSDHHIQNPLAAVERTCQTCHRDKKEKLCNNVYERQQKANELRIILEKELAKAHIEARFAWNKGASQPEMEAALKLIRQAQWRWDFVVASHGGSFHAPQETMRILGHGLNKAFQARLAIKKVLIQHGYTDEVPLPDISTKEKAQEYIGLDIPAEKAAKYKFLKKVVPAWLQKAKANERVKL